jgi:hypothetical protein
LDEQELGVNARGYGMGVLGGSAGKLTPMTNAHRKYAAQLLLFDRNDLANLAADPCK